MSRNKLSRRLVMLSAALTLAMSQTAFAGETVELNLQDAMERAFNTNPAISIAGYNVKSAKATLDAARSSHLLSITAKHQTQRGGYDEDRFSKQLVYDRDTGAFGQIDIPIGKQIGNKHSNTLTASLPIYTGGEIRGTVRRAKANYNSVLEGKQKAYNDTRATVTNGYCDLLQAGNMQQLGRESVQRLEDHLKNVQAQYEVGVVAKVDVLRSQVELSNAKQSLIQAENAYQVAEANLNRIVGLPMDTTLKLDNILTYSEYAEDMAYCLDYASQYRPELEQARQGVEAAKGALMVARSGYMPKIAASATQNWSDTNWPGDENGEWGVGVSVSVNVFDSGVTWSKINGAKADLAVAEETYRDTVDAVNLDVRNCYLNLREAEKRIGTTETAVSQAEEDYRIAQVRYMAGVGTNTDVLDAQVALTQAKTNYLQAMYDYNTSKTDLENAMGVPVVFPTKVTVEPQKEALAKAEAEVNKTAETEEKSAE